MQQTVDLTDASNVVSQSWSTEDGAILRNLSAGEITGSSRMKSTDLPEWVDAETLSTKWEWMELRGKTPRCPSSSSKSVKVVDLFCGCGGMSYGVGSALRSLGLKPKVVLAADQNQHALDVYERNIGPGDMLKGNIWQMLDFQVSGMGSQASFVGEPSISDPVMAKHVAGVDILIGGPPCRGHSSLNNHTRSNDPRNVLYLAMAAAAVALGVRAVIIENVPRVLNDNRRVVETAMGLLKNSGYAVSDEVVNCQNIGMAQTRKRHLMIATKHGRPDISAVTKSITTATYRTLSWAIEDLIDSQQHPQFDTGSDLSEENRWRIEQIFESGLYDMPDAIRPDCHKNGHTYPSIYGRLRMDGPSGTITSGFYSPGRGRYIHPERQRTLTPHEAARIQGFPDSFKFERSDGSMPGRMAVAHLIGDAVPPKLGFVAGLTAIAAMSEDKKWARSLAK
jgi:DNA (cytosine-5)-methyltransferase 1